jgi:opacity protein-like surface antigen
MKKSFFVAVLASAIACPAVSFAAGMGPYVSANIGAAILNDATWTDIVYGPVGVEYDTGIGVTGAVGYDMGMTRVEFEFGFRRNDIDNLDFGVGGRYPGSGDVTSSSFMFNGYYDFENGSPLTPYLGAGLGLATVRAEDAYDFFNEDADDTAFAYQFIAGLGYQMTPNILLDISYRYFATSSDLDLEGVDYIVDVDRYESHNIMVGVRFLYF